MGRSKGAVKAEEIEDKIGVMVNTIMSCLSDMPSAEYKMTEDMLETYCWTSVHLKDLTEKVNKEGAMVYVGGTARENPAIATIAKLAGKKSDYYTKIYRVLNASARETISSLDAFLKE